MASALAAMIIACAGTVFAQAPAGDSAWPETGKAASDFIPNGYAIAGKAEADFNRDKLLDLAMVLQKQGGKEETEGAPRWLVVLFKRADGRYALSLKSSRAVPASGSGLRADEEFMGPWAMNDTFKLRSGFSDGRHGVTTETQFRFQDGDWYVIGERSVHLGDVGGPEIQMAEGIVWTSHGVDRNFLTGTRIETWACGGCDDPEVKLTLTFHDGGSARTVHDYFENRTDGGGMGSRRASHE